MQLHLTCATGTVQFNLSYLYYVSEFLYMYRNGCLTFCGSIHIMTNLMMSNQGSWRMSRGHASTHCLTSSAYLYAGTHLSPSSSICNHPINPLNHTAIYPNPCLGRNVGGISPTLAQRTQSLLQTPLLYIE